jgi:hypothetical protein
MPAAAARKVTRTPRKIAADKAKTLFRQTLVEFLSNKAMIDTLTKRNQGDKKGSEKLPGLRDTILGYVMKNGDKDPETGSFFLELDEPVFTDIDQSTVRKVKAERRAPKVLDPEKALEWADEAGLRDKVEEFTYELRLTAEQATEFAALLKKAKLVDRVVSTDAVLVEENLLQIHYGKDPITGAPLTQAAVIDGKRTTISLLSEETLDSFYTENETWALVPQK